MYMYALIMYIMCRFVCAWLYYGVVLLTTTLLQYDPHCGMCNLLYIMSWLIIHAIRIIIIIVGNFGKH